MKPLETFSKDDARSLQGLLFDLDDTLLSHGTLTRRAYAALWDLHDAGLRLVAVTGRPSGWGEVLARQWPIAGAVTENGAIAITRDGSTLSVHDPCDETERRRRRVRLAQLAEQVREAVPEARLSDDVHARRSDLTWDIGERLKMPAERVASIVALARESGARTTRSSIHLHATFDGDDKASGTIRFLHDRFGDDASAALARYAFVGDSENDAACFAAFRVTFGVSNVRASVGRLALPPRFVAPSAMGEGFAEIAAVLLRFCASATRPAARPAT